MAMTLAAHEQDKSICAAPYFEDTLKIFYFQWDVRETFRSKPQKNVFEKNIVFIHVFLHAITNFRIFGIESLSEVGSASLVARYGIELIDRWGHRHQFDSTAGRSQ